MKNIALIFKILLSFTIVYFALSAVIGTIWWMIDTKDRVILVVHPDTCAICRNHIDTVKEREMMMYINGDFVFRNEVHRAYERRIKEMSKKHEIYTQP